MAVTGHPLRDDGPCPQPHPVLQCDRLHHQIKSDLFVIVIAGHEYHALRKAAIVTDGDFALVLDPDRLADPAIVPYGEFPRKLHVDAMLDDHALADLGPKCPQDHFAQPIERIDWIEDKNPIGDEPKQPFEFGGSLIKPVGVEARDIGRGELLLIHVAANLGNKCGSPAFEIKGNALQRPDGCTLQALDLDCQASFALQRFHDTSVPHLSLISGQML